MSLPAAECNPGQVVNTHVPVTKQYNQVPGWEGNHRSGVTLPHWPRITDISGSSPTDSRPRRGR